ncbi:MAG: dioxygenase family protein [Usitatibacter sp.]
MPETRPPPPMMPARPASRFERRRRLLAALGAAPFAWNALRPAGAMPTPLADFANECSLSPALSESFSFVDEGLNRFDLTQGTTNPAVTQGFALRLQIDVVSARGTGCLPLPGVQVDLWHVDALGNYSEFGAAAGQNYLRGYQVTDAAGRVAFKTIYPGWYPGRTVHLHAKARIFVPATGRTFEFDTQFFFDDGVNDTVLARAPYNSRGTRDTRNAADTVFGGRTATLVNVQPMPDGSDGLLGVATLSLDLDAPAATINFDQAGLTGHWYDPNTAGQGFSLEVFPNQTAPGVGQAFGAWFTYDTAPPGDVDKQRWYTFSGAASSSSNVIPVRIFRNIGGNFDAPPITSGVLVGNGALSFSTCTSGELAYAFTDGTNRTGVVPMSRLTPNITCGSGTALPTNADFALSGSWFDPQTSGQGFTIEVNPAASILFFSWYTYGVNAGAAGVAGQRWFTAQAPFDPGMRSIPLTIFQTAGGIFDQGTYPAPFTQAIAAGGGTLTFSSCTRASLQFRFTNGPMSGAAGTIALQRIGPTPPGCVG